MWLQHQIEKGESKSFFLGVIYKMLSQSLYTTLHCDEEDTDLDSIWKRIAPSGNIYRVSAMQAEHLKHSYDLQQQLRIIADKNKSLLDAHLKAKGEQPTEVSRLNLALQLLKDAPVENTDAEAGEKSDLGFLPLQEFLHKHGAERYMCLCGMLLPAHTTWFTFQLKSRVLAMLIASIQILAPLMIFLSGWNADTNYLKLPGGIYHFLSWKELTCLGSVTEASVDIIGTGFLIIIFEIGRSYVEEELANFNKGKYIPMDFFWVSFGNIVNQFCVFMTVLALPFIFWTEMDAKDIVWDSLGLLFIFQLDDLAGGALNYLAMEDDDFRRIFSSICVLLGQCPVDLEDVVNPDAKDAKDMWLIKVGPEGLMSARTGRKCLTRLSETCQSNEKEPLLTKQEATYDNEGSPFKEQRFYYKTMLDSSPEKLPQCPYVSALVRGLWHFFWYALLVMEVVVPPVFFTVNDPCYK